MWFLVQKADNAEGFEMKSPHPQKTKNKKNVRMQTECRPVMGLTDPKRHYV